MDIQIIMGIVKFGVVGAMLAGLLFIWRLVVDAREISRAAAQADQATPNDADT